MMKPEIAESKIPAPKTSVCRQSLDYDNDMFIKYFRKGKQDPSPENKRISCSLYNNGRQTKATSYYVQ